MRLFKSACLVAFLLGGALTLAAEGGEATPTSYKFRVTTPALDLALRPDGFTEVRIEEFKTRARGIGAPDIPTKTLLVAIPPGAEPRLEVRSLGQQTRRGVTPRPVPRRVGPISIEDVGRTDEERAERLSDLVRREWPMRHEADREIYGQGGPYPDRLAWLGEVGILRDQRYVEVHVAPVRFQRGSRSLEVHSGLELTVHFDGMVPRARTRGGDARFESIYRGAFVNYGQGRGFRVGADSVPTRLAADRAAGSRSVAGSSGPPIRRIRVREHGTVRLDYDLFLNEAPEFLAPPFEDPTEWTLTNRGEEVPYRVDQSAGVDPSRLEPGEWIQFYGQPLDNEPKTELNSEILGPDLYEMRDFTDENVYFLHAESSNQPPMSEAAATPTATTPEAFFVDGIKLEVDDVFFPLGAADPWYWSPVLVENGERTDVLELSGLVSGTLSATVRVNLRGASDCPDVDPDHHTRITLLNGAMEVLATDEAMWDGRTLYMHEFTWNYQAAGPQLTDPVHVKLEPLEIDQVCPSGSGPTANVRNDVYLDWVEVEYPRAFQAKSDMLRFNWPDDDVEFEIVGFDSGAADIEVYEITGRVGASDVVDAIRLTGATVTPVADKFTVRFHISDLGQGATREFMVAGAGGVAEPSGPDFESDTVSSLKQTTNQADLIVIAHEDVLDDGPGSPLDQLLALRASQGVSSIVARLGDVEDEFNDGLPGPLAIRNFLAWVMSTEPGEGWAAPKPLYVLLIGDGSYDYKGGTAAGNFVPTQMVLKENFILGYYASDNLLATVLGDDQLADLIVGRISARTVPEANAVVQKTLDYEQSSPPGAWRSNMVLIADRGKDYNDNEGQRFELVNFMAISWLAGTPYTYQNLLYWTDVCQRVPPLCDPEVMNQEILDAVNGVSGPGAAIAQFIGHGNFDLWSDDIIFCANPDSLACRDEFNVPYDDTENLINGLELPFLLIHNCLSGGFHTPKLKSLGEGWVKRSGGGAVALYAPSGLGYIYLGEDVTETMWGQMFGPPKARIVGVPVMAAQTRLCTQGSIEACQFHVLLGDPSLTLALPHVDPPKNLQATADDAEVELVWDPSGGPNVVYDVYRAQTLSTNNYLKIATVGVPSYTDSNVTNTLSYFYYVLARDLDGFESTWTNFNSDCDLPEQDREDCVKAVPLNLNPPIAPSGIVVIDAETGGRLDVAWTANPEDDIGGYTVHYGTSPGIYTGSKTVDAYKDGASLLGLENGTLYYLVVTATNTSGTLSDPSIEKTGTPNLVLGVNAPSFIGDLRVAKSGIDAALDWGAVTEDVYGKPLTADHYEVYRGTLPEFVPDLGHRIATPSGPSHDDATALDAGKPDYYYLVRALDGASNPGGLGRQLPKGILDLRAQWSDIMPGMLVLSWSPVVLDFDGNATSISHYDLYGFDEAFGRSQIASGEVPQMGGSLGGTEAVFVPAMPNRYYSVLAVDERGNESPF